MASMRGEGDVARDIWKSRQCMVLGKGAVVVESSKENMVHTAVDTNVKNN